MFPLRTRASVGSRGQTVATQRRRPTDLTSAIGVQCVGGEDHDANQAEYGCGGLDHRWASSLLSTRLPNLLFQAGFVGSGKRFRPVADWQMFNDKIAMRAHPLRRAGDDSDMLEPVVLLLSVATCALTARQVAMKIARSIAKSPKHGTT
jgi:hypothetical protein